MNKFSKPTSLKPAIKTHTFLSVTNYNLFIWSVLHIQNHDFHYLSDNLNYWVSESYAALNDRDEKPKCASLRSV